METTTFSEKTYFFYLEINENNYKNLCSSIPYISKFNGYEWKELDSSSCTTKSNYPITSSTDTSDTITFPSLDNTFYILNEITGKDTPTLTCSEEGLAFFDGVNLPNRTCSSGSGCFTDKIPYSQTILCNGKECESFFPPSKLTYTLPPSQNGLQVSTTPQIIYDGDSINNIQTSVNNKPYCQNTTTGEKVDICVSGNPTFTYNLYKPINYSNLPTLNTENQYVPPLTPIKAGFYNVFPLIASISLMNISIPSTTYAVYEIQYEIEDFNLLQNNQLLDFLNLQKYLQSTFSSSFNSYQSQNILSMKQLIIDYCNETSSMSDSVCNSSNLSSFFDSSPCIDPYSNCLEGWNNFCSQIENYNSSLCKNYYKSTYYNNVLDNSIQNNLKSLCSEVYESNPSILSSQEYLDTCACFLPQDVYKNFPSEISSDNIENWYYPCYRSSIKKYVVPPSPTSEIVSCMNEKYKNSSSTEDITNQTYKECYNEENTTLPSKNIPIMEEPTQSNNSDLDINNVVKPQTLNTYENNTDKNESTSSEKPPPNLTLILSLSICIPVVIGLIITAAVLLVRKFSKKNNNNNNNNNFYIPFNNNSKIS